MRTENQPLHITSPVTRQEPLEVSDGGKSVHGEEKMGGRGGGSQDKMNIPSSQGPGFRNGALGDYSSSPSPSIPS